VLQFPGAQVRRDEQTQDRSFFQECTGERILRKIQNRQTQIKKVRQAKPVFGCERNPRGEAHKIAHAVLNLFHFCFFFRCIIPTTKK